MNIETFLARFEAGDFSTPDRKTQIEAGWFDWFCKDTSLRNKTIKLANKLKTILPSDKIDLKTMYVFFKNNCPCAGSLYDDFRICDMETNDVIYTVVPRSGFTHKNNVAEVWGRENNFAGPLVEGSWKDVKNFFKRQSIKPQTGFARVSANAGKY